MNSTWEPAVLLIMLKPEPHPSASTAGGVLLGVVLVLYFVLK